MEVTNKSSQGQKESETLASHDNHQMSKHAWKDEVNHEIMKMMALKNKATRRMTLKNMATRMITLKKKSHQEENLGNAGSKRVDDKETSLEVSKGVQRSSKSGR